MVVPLATESWQDTVEQEGQLAVDVLETPTEVVVVATLAGTKSDKVSLHLHKDLLTIRGERELPVPEATNYFYQECFWGRFSRTIVLPVDVKEDSARAEYKNGILVIRFLKSNASGTIPLLIVEE
jgi:HSP20 family protein